MTSVRIDDVTEFVLDGTHASPIRTEDGVPVLSAQNVNEGRLDFSSDRYTSREEYENFKKRLSIAAGDVLLTIVGTIGRAAVVDEVRPLVFQRSVAVLRPNKDVLCPRFLYHFTQSRSFQSQLARASNQSSQAGVYLGKLKELRVPLPPLPEQRRIAEILDNADALRAKHRAALAQLDSLTHSIFLDIFGDPASNPKGWAIAPLRDLGRVTTGGTPPSGKEGMFGGPIPFITPSDLDSDEPIKRSVTNAGAEAAATVMAGATLVCCIGATIGKIRKTTVRSAFNQQINAVEWGDRVDPDYGYTVLRFFKPTIVAWGSSTTLPILKKSAFERIEIPVPPLREQREFAARLSQVDTLRRSNRTAQAVSDELFLSLHSRAFRGEL